MPRKFKLAILRARHDKSTTVPPDDACRKFLVDAPDKSAVLQYWSEATQGNIEFTDIALFPWVDIEVDASNKEQIKRSSQARAAVVATQQAGQDLGGYDIFVVLVTPGFATGTITKPNGDKVTGVIDFDAGATLIDGKRFAIIQTRTNLTFDCHEVGHILGYDHSYGLLNNGIDWANTGASSDVYGSPYDIMSSGAFGSKWFAPPRWAASPTFARTDLATVVPGWTGPQSWDSIGPFPSRAFVFINDPEPMEAASQVQRVTLDDANTSAANFLWSFSTREKRTSLLVVEDRRESGLRQYCVEYRLSKGWDQGLKTSGTDLARQGVVIHSIESKDGKSYPYFRGAIPIPLVIDTDVAIPNTNLAVRVVSVANDLSSVLVHIGVTGKPESRILIESLESDEKIISTKKRSVRVPHCGVKQFDWRTAHSRVKVTAHVQALNLGGPGAPLTGALRARWDVAGVILDTAATGSISVKANEGHVVSLQYILSADAAQLSLSSVFESTRFTVSIKASARESDDSNEVWSSPYLLENEGLVEGFDGAFWTAVRKCLPVEIRRFEIRFPGCVEPEYFRPDYKEVLITKQPSSVAGSPDHVDFELSAVAGIESVVQRMVRPAQRMRIDKKIEDPPPVTQQRPKGGSIWGNLIRFVVNMIRSFFLRIFGKRQ